MENKEILLESGTNEVELLTFLIGSQTFGINVVKVQSIEQFDRSLVTEVPEAPPAMKGMLLYRDKTIPIIDLAISLAINVDHKIEKKIVIVTEFNGFINCFKVDAVNRIHRVKWTDFSPLESLIGLNSPSVIGTIFVEGKDVMIVDLERILTNIFPSEALEELEETHLVSETMKKRKDVHVMFSEDSKTIRDKVVLLLKEAGYETLSVFENGQKTFDALQEIINNKENRGLPHIMVSDIEMPQMDGLTLCRKTKTELKLVHIPVIMFSSLINDQMIQKCKTVGADAYITKPRINELVGMLDKLCLKP